MFVCTFVLSGIRRGQNEARRASTQNSSSEIFQKRKTANRDRFWSISKETTAQSFSDNFKKIIGFLVTICT